MRKQALLRLLLIGLLFFGGNLLFFLVLLPYGWYKGNSVNELLNDLQSGMMTDPHFLRYSLFMQAFCQFIIPCLVFAKITYGKNILKKMDLLQFPGLGKTGLSFAFLLAAYPLVNLAFMANQSLPLSPWMEQFEAQATDILSQILVFDSVWQYLFSLLIIAILPAIGEELLFRGVIQKQFGYIIHPIAAVWMAAIFFSAAHFQFEGFLPRLALGAVLGYLYYWTGNLWIPILVHFFNNGIQVSALYFMDVDMSTAAGKPADVVTPASIILGIIVMFFCSEAIRSNSSILNMKNPFTANGQN